MEAAKGIDPYDSPSKDVERRYEGLFPDILTLACFSIFGAPLISTYRLTRDPSVIFWLDSNGHMVWIIPIMLAVCHVLHSFSGKPRFVLVLLSTVMPSLLLIFIGHTVTLESNALASRLYSTDCTTFQDKHNLETHWRDAYDLLLQCGNRTATETGQRLEDVLSALLLQDCDEYRVKPNDRYAEQRTSWNYLRALEETDECTGWCGGPAADGTVSLTGEVALWTNTPAKSDICSNTAATTLNSKVARSGERILTQAVVCLVVSVACIGLASERLNKHRINW